MNAPELLLPAGSLQHMQYAYAFGADAVYAGQPRYSLRVRNNDFHKLPVLAQGIEEAHKLGKQFFVASNLMPHNAKVKTYMADMEPVIDMRPDALIMADPGLIMMVRERWPEMPVHLSVQANTVNYQAVKFWQSLGLSRVILSRELSLDEIAEIRQLCPDMELEVFVHGALCIAYSGRCLLSGYFNHRDPNQGTCTNACRWDYKTHGSDGNDDAPQKIDFKAFDAMNNASFSDCGGQQRHPLADEIYLIEESNRPGEMMPIFEDEHGTYIMNSKDLRAVQHIERLVNIGVDSLKIEGRTKSVYYVARTAQIYRQAITDAVNGRPFDPTLIGKLDNLANRGYTDGFYQRHPTQAQQNYLHGYSSSERQQYVGEVTGYDSVKQLLHVDVKNRFAVGDKLELVMPQGNVELILSQLVDQQGQAIDVAPGSGHQVSIPYQGPPPQKAVIARFV
ncbi:tRNA 5-hydroxyuridine modification protein YegQ [Methylophaga sp. OBS4]|uniref:prephenate-dependent tRNA uridine(34) hydroxylase TrhP n=1 Tax=Methylophaga sp. OBS4 TaxID=2991935 RepID=UPI00224FE309|nr:tRNA 5-hydroxyuridine modification protein YegQ [Methylophaga sp. OBS4]MCX4188340.1 tRNA 5-hydroxyuridine modification protein YegQ [Methylophaga sp. OBS4]